MGLIGREKTKLLYKRTRKSRDLFDIHVWVLSHNIPAHY